jgi:hypothetical protein
MTIQIILTTNNVQITMITFWKNLSEYLLKFILDFFFSFLTKIVSVGDKIEFYFALWTFIFTL